jgi:hypothetical protein
MNGKISEKYIELATTNSSRRKRRRKKWESVVRRRGGGMGETGESRRKRKGQTKHTYKSDIPISPPAYYK